MFVHITIVLNWLIDDLYLRFRINLYKKKKIKNNISSTG